MSSPLYTSRAVCLKACPAVCLPVRLDCRWFKTELWEVLLWLTQNVPLAWLGELEGWGTGGGRQQRDRLSFYRSAIRPISSGWIKSCTCPVNPPLPPNPFAPAQVFHLNIFQSFQKVSLSSFSFFLHWLYCFLCYQGHAYISHFNFPFFFLFFL